MAFMDMPSNVMKCATKICYFNSRKILTILSCVVKIYSFQDFLSNNEQFQSTS